MPRPTVDRKPKRLGYGTLGLIASGIGGDARVRLIPGDAWGVEPDGRTILYPREALADTMESLALRSIYANVGHVLFSQQPSPWNTINKAIRRVERVARPTAPNGTPIPLGTFIPFGVMRVLERERIERVQRLAYAGMTTICGTLPRPYLYHLDERRPPNDFEQLLMEVDHMSTGEAAGKWLPQEVLDGVDLRCFLDAPDFKTALSSSPTLLAEITLRFLAHIAKTEKPEQEEGDGDEGESGETGESEGDGSGSGGQGQGQSGSSQGTSQTGQEQPGPNQPGGQQPGGQQPEPKTMKIPQAIADKLKENADQSGQGFMDAASVTGKQVSAVSAERDTLGADYEDLVDERLASILKLAFDTAIKPNRRWDIHGGLDQGKLMMRDVTKAIRRHGRVRHGLDHVHGKRIRNDKRRYRIAFMSDNSGSMKCGVQSEIYPNASRIELAARFVVSAITAVDHLPEVEVGVWVFDDEVHEVVPFGRHTTTEARRIIGAKMVTTGGGGTEAALAIANLRNVNQQPTRPNTTTILFLLSDGEWGNNVKLVEKEMQSLIEESCDMAVLTIGCAADEAKSFVGDERADEITDDNAGNVIHNHISRLLDPIN